MPATDIKGTYIPSRKLVRQQRNLTFQRMAEPQQVIRMYYGVIVERDFNIIKQHKIGVLRFRAIVWVYGVVNIAI